MNVYLVRDYPLEFFLHKLTDKQVISVILFVFALTTEQNRDGLTNDHEQLLLLLDDVYLKDRAQSRDVGQGVLDDVQGIQTFLRAHQHNLEQKQRKVLTCSALFIALK